jgi:hypothetical protein
MKCQAGACGADCAGGRGCGCWATGDTHEDCGCKCYGRSSITVKGGVKIAFKTWNPKIKPTPETKYDFCTNSLPITGLAELLDKFLPNKILVPANKLNKKVTLSLKNNTLRQIISASGLVLSTPAKKPVKKGK